MLRRFIFSTLCIAVVLGGYILWNSRSAEAPVVESVSEIQQPTDAPTDEISTPAPRAAIKLMFVGDIMLDRSVWSKMSARGLDYPFRKLDNLFTGADLVVANLEGPVTDRGSHAVPGGSLLFKFEPETVASLVAAGFDLVSLANNHTHNQGAAGLVDTQENLRAGGLTPFGHPRQVSLEDVAQVEVNGWTFAFIGWNMIEVSDTYQAELMTLIEQLDSVVDRVVILPHWGNEYKPQTSQQIATAHALIDAGVDLIIGAHPHTVQGVEIYNNRPIFYSLGNFIFDQYWSDPTEQGLAVRVTISETATETELVPIDLRESQPRTATEVLRETVLTRILNASSTLTETVNAGLRENLVMTLPWID